jgi:hypothetical protein
VTELDRYRSIRRYNGPADLVAGDERYEVEVALQARQKMVEVKAMGKPPVEMPSMIDWFGRVTPGNYDDWEAHRARPCVVELPPVLVGRWLLQTASCVVWACRHSTLTEPDLAFIASPVDRPPIRREACARRPLGDSIAAHKSGS